MKKAPNHLYHRNLRLLESRKNLKPRINHDKKLFAFLHQQPAHAQQQERGMAKLLFQSQHEQSVKFKEYCKSNRSVPFGLVQHFYPL
jgi:hypothetical protein